MLPRENFEKMVRFDVYFDKILSRKDNLTGILRLFFIYIYIYKKNKILQLYAYYEL